MNLFGIASGVIGSVNPSVPVTLQASTGYTSAADGSRVPTYDAPVQAMAQVQALSQADLRQMDALNVQGVMRSVYLPGDWSGIVRPEGKGGDILTMNGQTWLIVAVPEQFPDWTRAIICLQR